MSNNLLNLLKQYPNKAWNWNAISSNIGLEYIKAHPEISWNWLVISASPKITWETIKTNPKLPWNWVGVSRNSSITMEIINANLDLSRFGKHAKWDWYSLSEIISWDFFCKNLDKCWNTYIISSRMKWEDIKSLPEFKWDSRGLSVNPNITLDIVISEVLSSKSIIGKQSSPQEILNSDQIIDTDEDNPLEITMNLFDWDWYGLSKNINITWEIIKSNPHLPWNWYGVSCNPNIDDNIILQNHDLTEFGTVNDNGIFTKPSWDWKYLSRILKWSTIKSLSNICWDWLNVSKNTNITWEIVNQNDNTGYTGKNFENTNRIPWDWTHLSYNKNITWNEIRSNSDRPWNYSTVSLNPNITLENIKSCPKSWDWYNLSYGCQKNTSSQIRTKMKNAKNKIDLDWQVI